MSGDSDLSALSFESFCDTTTITSKTWSDEMNSELSRLVSGIDEREDTTNTKRKKKKKKKKKSKKKNKK